MPESPVENDELVYRRFHAGELNSGLFKLKRGEVGLSVDRAQFVSVAEALNERRGAKPNMQLASATAGEIRGLKNAAGDDLHLDVIPDDDDGTKPGHALIIVQNQGKLTQAASRSLQRLFALRNPINLPTDTS